MNLEASSYQRAESSGILLSWAFGVKAAAWPMMSYLVKEGQYTTKKVQVPNIERLWPPKPYHYWYLGSESLNIGYLDPLGEGSLSVIPGPRCCVSRL